MTQSYGPKSINDNLLVYLDARNIKSYAGEPTTNLNNNGDFENNSTSGWSFDPKTDGTWSIISSDKKYGSYCAKLTNSTVSSIALWQPFSMNSGEKYTMSCWIKNVNCPTTPVFNVTNATFDENASTTITTNLSAGSDWSYVSKTFTTNATGTCNPYIRTSANVLQGYFLVDDFQVEKKSYGTPFVNGTRSPVNGWKDLSGNGHHADLSNMTGSVVSHYKDKNVISPRNNAFLNFNGSDTGVADYALVGALNQTYSNFSVEFWIKLNGTAQLDDADRFWSWNTGGTMTIRYKSTPTIQFHYNPADGSPASTSINGPTLSPAIDVWLHVVVTNDRTDTSTGAKVYINGVSGTGGEPSVPLLDTSYILGTGLSATVPTACDIAIYKLYSKSLTSEEVLNNYNIMKGRFE